MPAAPGRRAMPLEPRIQRTGPLFRCTRNEMTRRPLADGLRIQPGSYPSVSVPIKPPDVAAVREDLRQEQSDLEQVLLSLDVEDWDMPTPAAGWMVRDQVSHLAFFDEAAALAITDPSSFQLVAEQAMRVEGDPMEEHLRRGRAMSGSEVLAWWRAGRQTLATASTALRPDVRVPWFGPPMGAMSFLSARLMETWAHGQDVADALGIVRIPTDRLRHIAHLGVRARPFSYVVHGRPVPDGPVGVVLTGPSGDVWEWETEEGSEDRVSGSALDFCLVVTQRRNAADTDLEIQGPIAREWLSIAQAFAGPPGRGRPPRGSG